MSDHEKDAEPLEEESADAANARAEKAVADAIEEAIDQPVSIEEAELLEAAELVELEVHEDT